MLNKLDQLCELGLIERSTTKTNTFTYKHTLVRQAALQQLGPSKRALVHASFRS